MTTTKSQIFELMPDEELLFEGVVNWYDGVVSWMPSILPKIKTCDGYLTSHRMVICKKLTSYLGGLLGELTLLHKSTEIACEFPLADILQFSECKGGFLSSAYVYTFDLRDGRKYKIGFWEFREPWDWVAAIEAALQSVQKN